MKRIAFKILSILLAAVILVAALPVTAFAEDEYCSSSTNGEHTFVVVGRYFITISISQESHLVENGDVVVCTWCGIEDTANSTYDVEDHDFGDEVDPEYAMSGTCIVCGALIEW